MTHRDSLGNLQEIEAGAVNWMVAGRGIVHSERYEALRRDGGGMHGLQIWVALPTSEESSEPSFQHYPSTALPTMKEAGMRGRLLAGKLNTLTSPVDIRSPLYLMDMEMDAGTVIAAPSEFSDCAAYAITGAITCDGNRAEPGQVITLAPGSKIVAAQPSRILWFGGEPVGTRYIWWNFVASSMGHLEAAKERWRGGLFDLPPGDNDAFTPLPADGETAFDDP